MPLKLATAPVPPAGHTNGMDAPAESATFSALAHVPPAPAPPPVVVIVPATPAPPGPTISIRLVDVNFDGSTIGEDDEEVIVRRHIPFESGIAAPSHVIGDEEP